MKEAEEKGKEESTEPDDIESSGSDNNKYILKKRGMDPPGFDSSNSARRVVFHRSRTYSYEHLNALVEDDESEQYHSNGKARENYRNSKNMKEDDPEEEEKNEFDLVIYNVHSNLQKIKTTASQENVFLFIATMWMAVTLYISFDESLDKDTVLFIIGVVVNANFVVFYGAPLSTIYTVISTRATVTIHIPTMLLNTLNGAFWGIYGITVSNLFVIIPNGLGVLLGIVQIILVLALPRYPKSEDGQYIRSSRRTLFILASSDLDRRSLRNTFSKRGSSLITDPAFYQGKTERLWL